MDQIMNSSGSFPLWITSMLAFVLLFLGLAIRVVVKELGRSRREGYVGMKDEVHFYPVPGLGTTMADGGEPSDEDGGSKD